MSRLQMSSATGHRQDGEHQGGATADRVGDRHDPAAVEAVDQHARGQAEEQPWQERQCPDGRDRERIAGEGRRDQRNGGASDAVGEVAEGGGGPELAEVTSQARALGTRLGLGHAGLVHGGERRS